MNELKVNLNLMWRGLDSDWDLLIEGARMIAHPQHQPFNLVGPMLGQAQSPWQETNYKALEKESPAERTIVNTTKIQQCRRAPVAESN